jgi:phosphopantothenoylcysteine decarboxylase/phosphopantothenate--cysteine ligase
MNTNMWRHPATRANLATLAARGGSFVGPDRGELACGWVGEGRMIDPSVIVDTVLGTMGRGVTAAEWANRRVLVSAGPTRAHIDPVRFVSNASTGVMGFAVAAAASRRGADVTLVAGPVNQATPAGVRRIDVVTADDMLTALDAELSTGGYDLLAMVAAVADVVPTRSSAGKLAKDALVRTLGELDWQTAVDVLGTLTRRHAGTCMFLGFAAETVDHDDPAMVEEALVRAGTAKLGVKGCQALFVNRVGAPGVGFASDTNAGVLLVAREDDVDVFRSGTPTHKLDVAGWILDRLVSRLPPRSSSGGC